MTRRDNVRVQFLLKANLRGVITHQRELLDHVEKMPVFHEFLLPGGAALSADFRDFVFQRLKQDLLLRGSAIDEVLAKQSLAARIKVGESGEEGRFLVRVIPFRDNDVDELVDLCDYISFNSLSQWTRFSKRASRRIRSGRERARIARRPRASSRHARSLERYPRNHAMDRGERLARSKRSPSV